MEHQTLGRQVICPSKPAYYIVDCRIFSACKAFHRTSVFIIWNSSRIMAVTHLIWMTFDSCLVKKRIFYYFLIFSHSEPLFICTEFLQSSSLKYTVWRIWFLVYIFQTWILQAKVGRKNPVQTVKKIQFIKLDNSNRRMTKIKGR